MSDLLSYLGQAVVYAAIAGVIGYFSANPAYHQVPDGHAQIKLAFNHGAARVEDCRRLSSQEIAKLAPKDRRPNTCTRERVAITIKLTLDGKPLYDAVLQPTGLSGDGPAQSYAKFIVPAGRHVVEARMRDSKRPEGFDYENRFEGDIAEMQNLAIDFKAEQGGFLFR